MNTLFDPQVWLSLLTLTALEVVLSVDNLVVIALLVGKLPARSRNLVLRLDMRGLGSTRLGARLADAPATKPAADPTDLQAAGKTLEVALLLIGKVDCERFNFHGGRRSSCGHDRWRQRNGLTVGNVVQAVAPQTWFLFGPASFVAAEHGPAGISDSWLHCNIQVACQSDP